MATPAQLAQALSHQGEIRNQPQNRFLGGVADVLKPVSEFLDRDKISDRIPFLGGLSAADLTGLKGAQSLVNDMSYGTPPIRGASLQTAKVDPRVLDLAGVSGAMMPAAKSLGKAALREGARQIETGTGFARLMPDPRMGIVPEGKAMSVEFGKHNPPKQLGGAFPEMAGVERFPNPAVVAVTNDLSMRTLPDGRFQADYLPQWGSKGKPFSAVGDNPQEIMDAALNRIGRSSRALEAGKKYDAIPNTWKGDARNISKKLIDEYGDIQFGSSTQSKSKYATLPDGKKIRMSDHNLPGSYEGADYDFRYGSDLNEFMDSIAGRPDKAMSVPERNGVGGAMIQRPKTEFEILHDTAQRNAALPVEQGGLGLPANNTYIDRANAPGMWPTDAYHGAFENIHKFDNDLLGKNTSAPSAKQAHFFAGNPETASSSTYATPTADQAHSYFKSSLGIKNDADVNKFISDYVGNLTEQGSREKSSSAILKELQGDVLKELNGDKLDNLDMHDETRSFLSNILNKYDLPPDYLEHNFNIANSQNLKNDGAGELGMKFRKLYADIHKKDRAISDYTRNLDASNKFDNYNYSEDYIKKYGNETAPSVYPVRLNTQNSAVHDYKGVGYREESYADLIAKARQDGFDTNIFKNTFDGGKEITDIYAVQNPTNIRSRFAAFDPMRRHEADILAGVGVGGMLDPQAIAEALRQQDRK